MKNEIIGQMTHGQEGDLAKIIVAAQLAFHSNLTGGLFGLAMSSPPPELTERAYSVIRERGQKLTETHPLYAVRLYQEMMAAESWEQLSPNNPMLPTQNIEEAKILVQTVLIEKAIDIIDEFISALEAINEDQLPENNQDYATGDIFDTVIDISTGKAQGGVPGELDPDPET